MLFSLIVALMVILVAAFWTYQGFFSSAIMFFETLIAGMLAFAFYEALHGVWAESLGDGLGKPVALMLIFVVSLTVFRTLTDRYVTKDVELPVSVARAGGAICGFFSGMLLVGMALIAIQMLPIGSETFAFERMS
ncbi:MAG: CvpA family protein, partial [Phycisphaerales bacterium]|nr:CvpA family protein [Phycisphaerales bacterium]